MISCTVKGVKLSFDFTFFAAVGIFLALDESGYGIFCLSACLLHEAAHLAVLFAEKKPPDEIIFSGGGISIRQEKEPSLCALAAGCAANLLLFAVFYPLGGRESVYPLIFGAANLCVCAINLLPVGELDGKKLLLRLLYKLFSQNAAEKTAGIIEAVFTAAAAAAILLMLIFNFNLKAVLILLYLFLVDFLQKRS